MTTNVSTTDALREAPTVARTIRFKPDLAKEIENRAENENRPFSNMVETMILKYLNYEDKLKESAAMR